MPHINMLTPDVGFPHGSAGSESACNIRDSLHIGDRGSIPGQEDPLEKEMTTQSCSLAREILWTEEPGGLQSMGCRVEHN